MSQSRPESAQEAYDQFASVYDRQTAQNDYETWIGQILMPELVGSGLEKGWALDIGCGTGRAFEALLKRGWKIVGCDVSEEMLNRAREKFGSDVTLVRADARDLPVFRPSADPQPDAGFSLILLLNDVLNYLTEDHDLISLFEGVKRNLNSSRGLCVFDANTLALFQRDFVADPLEDFDETSEWQRLTKQSEAGAIYEARFSGFGVSPHVHRQRYWVVEEVQDALATTGLRCLATFGQREVDGEIRLSEIPDEVHDDKTIFIVTSS